MEVDSLVVCQPATKGATPSHPATIQRCTTCGADVWLADSSAEAISVLRTRGVTMRIVCQPCGWPLVCAGPNVVVVTNDRQRAEVGDEQLRWVANLLGRRLVNIDEGAV